MPRFHTGYHSHETREAASFRGAGFSFEKKELRYPRTEEERLKYWGPPDNGIYVSAGGQLLDGEILIKAPHHNSALRAFRLFLAAISVVDCGLSDLGLAILGFDRGELDVEGETRRRKDSTLRPDVERICKLAARASLRRSHAYALHKLYLSFQSAAPDLQYIDPHGAGGYKIYRVETDPMAHVRLSNAITLAYSAIEELRLEPWPIAGSTRMPDGSWKPEVRLSLEKRLRAARVDPNDSHVWTLRGPPTRIEKKKRLLPVGKASWSHGAVRDVELSMIDALAMASWLRSKITAHKLDDNARSLTGYDAHNVQFLARQLIMSRLGVWRSYEEPTLARER